jgi:hypothetical protein
MRKTDAYDCNHIYIYMHTSITLILNNAQKTRRNGRIEYSKTNAKKNIQLSKETDVSSLKCFKGKKIKIMVVYNS